MTQRQSVNRARPGLLLPLLCIILTSIYLITYSAHFQSGDTRRIFDASSSLARFGDTGADETFWQESLQQSFYPDEAYPLIPYEESESLIVYIGAALYSVIDRIPAVGLVHGVFLLNIITTVASAAVFYGLAQQLGFDNKTAFSAALLLGLGTIVWWYSKTLFRAPVVMLFLLIAASLIQSWHSHYRRVWLLLPAILMVLLAFLTKNSSALAWFGLAALALPEFRSQWLRRLSDLILAAGLLLLVVAVLYEPFFNLILNVLMPLINKLGLSLSTRFTHQALFSYLLSPGGSLIGSSPVLLLAPIGAVMLIQQGKRRLVWGCSLMILGYIVGHALLTGQHWFGGLSVPPRFLVPVVPFAMILCLPVIEWFWQSRSSFWRVPLLLLVVYSAGVQIILSLSLIERYSIFLPEQALGLLEWQGGMTDPRYFRWVVLPRTWGSLGFDTAWDRADLTIFPFIFFGTAIAAVVLALIRSAKWQIIPALALLVVVPVYLQQLYANDHEYWADSTALSEVTNILNARAHHGEPLVLAAPIYDRFVMNNNRLNKVRPIVFDHQPGEALSSQEPARVTSPFIPDLLTLDTVRMLDHLGAYHERMWYLAHNSIYLDYSVRPLEQYLNTHYYLVNEWTTKDPAVRLLLYDTTRAPQTDLMRLPEIASDIQFGEHIRLLGLTLARHGSYHAGDTVPFTLYWQTNAPLAQNYVVASFLMKADHTFPIIEGYNSQPQHGFSPTTAWHNTTPVADNRALVLPENAPAGDYELWVVLYDAAQGADARLPVTSGSSVDATIAVLPVTIAVTPDS